MDEEDEGDVETFVDVTSYCKHDPDSFCVNFCNTRYIYLNF